MHYETFFKKYLVLIEKRMRREFGARRKRPFIIHQAMQYAAFTGGKRFRPVLTLASCEACGGKPQDAILAALAIELIHTYSLVHDDLPALDNDDIRRGKPTCHKKFSEANAILAGDGLLTLAFEFLAGIRPADRAVRLVHEVATAAGVHGMIGGQVADLETPARKKSLAEHDFISRYKTGALLRVAPIDDTGELILEEYEKLLGPRTKIVAAIHVSNALGTINPIQEMTRLAGGVGAKVVVDGAQAAPHMAVNVRELGCEK